VCFDIYDKADGNPNNATGEAPAITLKWGSTVIAESRLALSDLVTGDGFAEVIVRLTADGLLDVAFNGKVLLYRNPVPGFGSISGGRFGFFARTGGLNANQWVDNLNLYTYLSAPLRVSRQPASLTVLTGRSATFDAQVNTPAGATYRWFRNGAPIADCGANMTAEANDRVDLDGSASRDPEGAALEYLWTLASVPDCSALTPGPDTVFNGNTASPSVVPDCEGSFVVSLAVSDGLAPVVARHALPALDKAASPELRKWNPLALSLALKASVLLVFLIFTSAADAMAAALRGGELAARSGLALLAQRGLLKGAVDDKLTYAVALALAAAGLAAQAAQLRVPFPLSMLTWPVAIADWAVRHYAGVRSLA
jgi:hypothetical protein